MANRRLAIGFKFDIFWKNESVGRSKRQSSRKRIKPKKSRLDPISLILNILNILIGIFGIASN